jgi:3-phenylpropionate/trans-cinnamate dioxygenase ferredoxin reductase subunit
VVDRVVVVGASLAGMTAAETLRQEGFEGSITIVGDEVRPPYDRPPLSKQVLAGAWGSERVELPATRDELGIEWRLGSPAVGLQLDDRQVLFELGPALPFDGLVIATGASPRQLPGTAEVAGVHTLRTLDDCVAIRSALEAGVERVVVVGAGFIGAEVAATCRGLGVDVTLVEALPVPLWRVLGSEIGAVCAALHRDNGVDVRLGVGVDRIEADARRHVARVHLADGAVIDASLVVVGIGVVPNTAWLQGAGLSIENGVLCDATMLAAPGVVAAGDVARWPNAAFDGEVMRVEHWDNAVAMGEHAARRLLAELTGAAFVEPFAPIPWFWSDQYDRKIQLAGRAGPDDDMAVVHGSLDERRFVALYGRNARVVGALGFNMAGRLARYRASIARGLAWDDALAEVDG